jgi:hypothetical protein
MIATGMLALTTSLSAGAQQTSHQQKYCGSLASFHTHVTALDSLGPNSTVGEVRALANRIQGDAQNVTSAAGKMKTPAADQFNDAAKKLREDAKNIPPGTTLDQARSSLRGDVQNVKGAAQQLANESGCPQVMGGP